MASYDPRALLNPKGQAKEKAKKRMPNYEIIKMPFEASIDWLFGRKKQPDQENSDEQAEEADLAPTGPKQSRKPAPPESNETKQPSWQADPKMLLNPKAASSANTTSNATNGSAQSNGEPAANGEKDQTGDTGMLSMVERMYNVTNREAPPAKKRKVEREDDEKSDEEGKESRSTFSGASSNGVLGQHVKEQQQKAAATTGPDSAPIDLTNDDDDDDDVQIISSKSKEDTTRVCLGMLHAQANVHHIPQYPKSSANVLGKDMYPMIRVKEKRAENQNLIIDLFARSPGGGNMGNKFGRMDVKVAGALSPLLDGKNYNGLELKVFLDPAKKQTGEFEGARVSRLMSIRILLEAPKNMAIGIGKILSQKGHFLSNPAGMPIPRDMEIYNPHVPQSFGPKPQSSAKRGPGGQLTYGVNRTQEEMLRETNSMFDDLIKSNEIPEMEPDTAAIKTELEVLQKQALHFLTEHERSKPIDGNTQLSLWKERQTTKGTVWANVITNHELSHPPEPVQGGILADVMGLGKTLSILSLIAATREEAKAFGDEQAPLEPEHVERNAKATLVVCPKSVMTNWTQQIKEHTRTSYFKVYQYHGSDRTQELDDLASYDVVLVPYGTVAAEFSAKNGGRDALAAINWFRIVLDEAHSIRTPSTHVSRACCALTAQRRWAVTGTPVQNRLDDLGTLIKFLRIKPFDDEMSFGKHIMAPLKTADPNVLAHLQLLVASMTLRRTKEKVGLPERSEMKITLQFSDEEQALYAMFSGQANLQVRALTRDKGRIQGKGYAFMLRSIHRLRAICAHGQEMLSDDDMKELQGLTAQTAIELGDEPDGEPDTSFITESQAYDFLHMMIESTSDLCTGCGKHIAKKEDPEVAAEASGNEDSAEEDSDDEDDSEDESDEDLDSGAEAKKDILGYINPCYDHLICPDCKDNYVREARENQREDGYHHCPYCEEYIRFGLYELKRSALHSYLESKSPKNKKQRTKWDESTYSGPHTKVKALVDDLKHSAMQSEMLPSGQSPIKSVVFSGWTTYLDLIEYALDENSIPYTRLDGSMSIKQRTAVLDAFRTRDDLAVILVSIKAGGQGLNLTAASKVYMMEPQFNPGVEQQAIDRVHRLGQTRDVEIKHFVMEKSIEEAIQKMQERKTELARLAMEKKISRGEAAKKRVEELQALFK